MGGKHWSLPLMTFLLLACTHGIFLMLIYPHIRFSPLFTWVFELDLFFLWLELLFMCNCIFRDPGFLPRIKGHNMSKLVSAMPPGLVSDIGFCRLCSVIRPEANLSRTKHCRYCDCCVQGFDHHCPWLNNCIGKRTYPFFCTLITLVSVNLLIMIICTCIIYKDWILASCLNRSRTVLLMNFAGGIFFLWSCFFLTLLGALTAFHMFLISKGLTTHEFLKGVPQRFQYLEVVPNCPGLLCWTSEPTLLRPMWQELDNELETIEAHYEMQQTLELIRSKLQVSNPK